MSFEIRTTPDFEKSSKLLSKRHRSFKEDIRELVKSLAENPEQGDELSPGIRKIRFAIKSKGRGKSGGGRVITYTIYADVSNGRVYLLEIYDKSDFSTVDVNKIKEIIANLGL